MGWGLGLGLRGGGWGLGVRYETVVKYLRAKLEPNQVGTRQGTEQLDKQHSHNFPLLDAGFESNGNFWYQPTITFLFVGSNLFTFLSLSNSYCV